MIEHADEHISEERTDIAGNLDGSAGLQFGEGIGPMEITLFGNRYNVRDAVEAAIAVQPHLSDGQSGA